MIENSAAPGLTTCTWTRRNHSTSRCWRTWQRAVGESDAHRRIEVAMSFLYPAFLIGSVAIAVPIVLPLLRRDVAPEVPFTAVRLLRRSPIERPARRRLRELLLLVARVIAL